jgi:uncharacterized protein (DUF2147 family)
MKKILTLAIALAFATMPALAADVTDGEWLRDDGGSRVQFTPCGEFLCGSITWLRDKGGTAYVGQKVFYDMKPVRENIWEGKAFNPEDGKEYGGKMTLNGDSLVTEGCFLFICKTANWVRP